MNPRSRNKGKGGGSKPKRYSDHESGFIEPIEAEAKPSESLKKVREQALGGLTDLVGLALATLADCLKHGPTRAQGSRSSDARYVLDVVLDRIAAAEAVPEDVELDAAGKPAQTPVDQLAKRRAQLQALLQAQRRDMDKGKR